MEEAVPEAQPVNTPEEKPKDKFSKREIGLLVFVILAILGVAAFAWKTDKDKKAEIDSFATCAAAGNPIMESYPEQCSANGQTWTNPDQQIQAQPNPTPDESEDDAIALAALGFCTAREAGSSETAKLSINSNMQDATLFIKQDGFARLSMGCEAEGGGFRLFLEEQPDGTWVVLGGTQEETLSCSVLDKTGIPAAVASNCFDENGELRTIQPVV